MRYKNVCVIGLGYIGLPTAATIAAHGVHVVGVDVNQGILETIRANQLQACYIRPLVFRGYEVLGVDPRACPVEVIIAANSGTNRWVQVPAATTTCPAANV